MELKLKEQESKLIQKDQLKDQIKEQYQVILREQSQKNESFLEELRSKNNQINALNEDIYLIQRRNLEEQQKLKLSFNKALSGYKE